MGKTESNDLTEYLELFKFMYEDFVEENKTYIESNSSGYFLDFDEWILNANGTGFANIWVQPKQTIIYRPSFKCPIPEIEIESLLILIKTKLLDIKPNCKIVSFEMTGHFNPSIWRGRNSLKINQIGGTVITGCNRVILEQDQMFSTYHIKYIKQNYYSFLEQIIDFYFGGNELISLNS